MRNGRLRIPLGFLLVLVMALGMLPSSGPVHAGDGWDLIGRPGHHLILRHELAPGIGDPGDFEIGDCSTQRNLNAQGRANARALGVEFDRRGVDVTRVLSSEWCRCLQTADLLGLGPVEPLSALNSSWRRGDAYSKRKLAELLDELNRTNPSDSLVLVTHQANISALTGRRVRSGEGFVIRVVDGEVVVAAAFSGGGEPN